MRAGTTQDARQQRLYWQSDDLWATLSVNPDLQDPFISRIELFQFYSHQARHAKYSKYHMD